MGFSENAGKRAALATGNSDMEAAIAWIMEHMDDVDLNDPPVPAGPISEGPTFSAEAVMMLSSMGFAEAAVRKALWEKQHDLEGASEWLLTHAGELDSMDLSIDTSSTGSSSAAFEDGAGKYDMVGIVSHMGKTTATGHYVAHVKRDGRWIFCNDRSVTLSQAPPLGRGFLYFYRRRDAPAMANQIGAPVALAAE
jgi:ubiquitin carboxyl-terminal hydrolase 5/13